MTEFAEDIEGTVCPKCGEDDECYTEMRQLRSRDGLIHLAPTDAVHCLNCGYEGARHNVQWTEPEAV